MRARRDGQTGARPIKAIVQPGLTQTIYKLLRDKIANHDYAPGERLQLDTLAIQLGVSRTPVRDALNQLAAEGLVEIRPRRGTSVAKLLARQLTERQIHTLARLLEKLVKLVDGAAYVDYGAYLECDRAFHSAIVQMLGNSRLTALYEEINLPLWLVRAQQDAGAPRDARDSLAEHQAIWAALAARDPHAAAEAMAAHIESSLGKLGVQLTPADHDELVNSRIPW